MLILFLVSVVFIVLQLSVNTNNISLILAIKVWFRYLTIDGTSRTIEFAIL
jgi:hypothetical protein